MRIRAAFYLPCLCLVFAGFSVLGRSQVLMGTQTVDTARLEAIEDLSESLANDMLDLSVAVRDRDLNRIAEFFSPELSAEPFPSQPENIKQEVKWVGTRGWRVPGVTAIGQTAVEGSSRTKFLDGFAAFLAHFSDLEDVRFKVKQADSEDPRLGSVQSRLAFFLIGRDPSGKREWVRGTTNISATRAEGSRWQIESFSLTSLSSMVASSDLFSEVAAPAGLEVIAPPYGSEGNQGFVWPGAAAGDLNGDGFIDLFVTAAARNYLYLNAGNGTFREVSEESGVRILLVSGSQPLLLDYDNDGDLDVFISAVGTQILLRNRLVPVGTLGFDDVSLESGVYRDAIGFSAVAADVNGDSYADIYVASYNRYGAITPDSWFQASNGTPDLLFINQRDGTFREQASAWGVADSRWSYASVFADVNADSRPDLLVANDFGEKALFINTGSRFVDEARERGVLDPGNGMGVAFGDFNNDGLLDVHTTNMSSTAGNRILSRLFPGSSSKDNVLIKLAAGNNLFENRGNGFFRDVTAEVGGFSGGWAWGGGFIDFDNDGWEDVYTPNGFISGKSMKDT